jgi:tripartite-type tricarboxylate transporter receptor subunit TctC
MTACAHAAIAASLLSAMLASVTFAQTYPSKPVRILAGYAGGPGDISMRGISQILQQSMGQPFVVDNRAGADGIIAGEACVRSAPDGYTVCMFDAFMLTLNPVIRAKMPYDPARDMVPIMFLGFLPAAIWADASLPANSLSEVFDVVRAKPGSIAFASFGLASAANLYLEYWKNDKNIQFLNVPYKTASLAWQGLVSGQVQLALYSTSLALPYAKAGKIKALAVNTEKRLPELPEVPTNKEAGLDMAIVTWYGVLAPAGTPREIVQRLNAEISKGLIGNAANRSQFLDKPGIVVMPPAGESPEAFAAFMQREREMFAGLVKAAKVVVE